MDLTSAKTVKSILEENDLSPKKSLGQNFLIDKEALGKVVRAANLSKEDVVIEVGSGLSSLTNLLSISAKKVIAIEKDTKMISVAKKHLKAKNVTFVNEDILKFNIPEKEYKVVANLPYYITSPIIRKFLEEKYPPSLLVLTVQKEVAERIIAKPPSMNLLAVSVQFFALPKVVSHISPCSFFPQPSVASSILQIIPYNRNRKFSKDFNKNFFALVKAGFSHPRKQLGNNLKSLNIEFPSRQIKNAGIDPKQRAETLSVKEWILLAENLFYK